MEGAAGIIVLLIVAGFAAFSGLGMLWGAGGGGEKKENKEGGGMNVGKIVTVIVIGLFIAMWLEQPGADRAIAGSINSVWGNLARGLQPLVSIAAQLLMLAAGGYVLFLLIRRHWRR